MTATAQTAPVAGAKTAWKLDPTHTVVEFSAKHLMITTVKGRIADIEGIIYSDEKDFKNSSVEATLKAESLAENSTTVCVGSSFHAVLVPATGAVWAVAVILASQ